MPLLTLQAKGALRRLETQVEKERLNIAPPLMQNHQQAPRVRIDPPKFSGDCLKYYGWRNTWNTFHESPSYTDSERSQLLEAALQGEAKTATERFTFSADTYHHILQFLADRFGNRSTIIGKLEARLRLAASSKLGEDCTASQLREKHISISNERQGLLDQGVAPATFDTHTAQEILRSLPPTITERWRFLWGVNHAVTLDEVLAQVDNLIQVRSLEEAARQYAQPAAPQQANAQANTARVTFRSQTPPRAVCVICNRETHNSHYCSFGNGRDRRRKIMDDERCLKCLAEGHRYRDCSSTMACQNCQATSHATVLCTLERRGRSPGRQTGRQGSRSRSRSTEIGTNRNAPTPPRTLSSLRSAASPSRNQTGGAVNTQANVSTMTEARQKQVTSGVLLNFTAKAQIRGTNQWLKVRGIIDNGSSNSFVTADLVRRINAEVTGSQMIAISSFGNEDPDTDESDIVHITLAGKQRK
ncbi:hypothetical protein DAPPUDRAFT_273326 [Daphnia pulex]|uniref:CCHC-type domain-containing protein n=1 Tax=Daphnia pulex TaxID=6669 RepID=E9I3H4_DAPPU|nr:hypothetical protein DAPPUDRAFT_273326 [Daphnia pulex]|eukprot:EFX61456.1 hypothetical protein DAPPUDRAFT_273326 [Daphnia pulex]